MEKKTPLYARHEELGGKIVPFGGFLLPVQYPTGVIAEHKAMREHAGIFDVSHMGEAILEGPDALKNLENLMSNLYGSMKVGACRYGLLMNEQGGVVDDLIAYRRGEDKFLLVPNAANKDKDVAWIKDHISGDVTFKDVSDQVAQIALQGPDSKEIITKVCNEADLPAKYYTFVEGIQVAGCSALVSRTGYTGEFGYEIYVSPADVLTVWNALLDAGAVPCGLGARDTLRLEAAMPLYGHELTDDIDPLTAGLQFAIKTDNHEFIGKQAMLDKHAAAHQKRVGLKVTGRGIVREHETIYSGDKVVGQTTSGTMCPTVGMAIAMAYVDDSCAEVGTALEVEVRGRRVPVEVIPMPFYTAPKK